MADDPSARLFRDDRSRWSNAHRTFTQRIAELVDVWNARDAEPLPAYRGATRTLQGLIGEARDRGLRLRAFGAGWSFSRIAATDGILLNTKPLDHRFTIRSHNVAPEYAGRAEDLVFTQCGRSVFQLTRHLESTGRSLKTSGASSGQTMVGGFSTGTHGSAIDVGALQDPVVGLHLIVSPTRHVWLERASYPVVSDGFVSALATELVRDDELFDATLVGLGAFGIVHGAMVESEPIYLLDAHRERMPLDGGLRRLIRTLDFQGSSLPHGDERPYHFHLVVDPHDLARGAYVTTMYKRPYTESYTPPARGPGRLGPGDEAPAFIGAVTDVVPRLIPTVVRTLVTNLYRPFRSQVGTLGEIFSHSTTEGNVSSTAVGVRLADAERGLDVILDVHRREGPFAGVISLRFVPASKALLAFTRFDPTCILELDGVHSGRTRQFYRRAWDALDEAGIPYTFHWGKIENLGSASVRARYGDALERWLSARRALLDPPLRALFSNPMLDRLGMSE